MTTSTISAETKAYLDAVRGELDDLPDEERGDLLEDVSSHLAELSTHDTGDGASLEIRLGPPSEYAAELRAAAGLPPRAAPTSTEPTRRRRLADVLAHSGAGRLATRARHHPWTAQVLSLLRELRPAWWILRGYLVIAVPALWAPDRHDDFPLPTVLGSGAVGGALVVAAMAASVAIGRRGVPPRVRPLLGAADVALALGALSLLGEAGTRTVPVHHFDGLEQSYALVSPYGPITNIYPYSLDGSPLEQVLLFDQDGRPLRVERQQWWPDGCDRVPRHPLAADGVPVPWVFPQTYSVRDAGMDRACDAVRRPTVPLPTFADRASEPEPPVRQPDVPGEE